MNYITITLTQTSCESCCWHHPHHHHHLEKNLPTQILEAFLAFLQEVSCPVTSRQKTKILCSQLERGEKCRIERCAIQTCFEVAADCAGRLWSWRPVDAARPTDTTAGRFCSGREVDTWLLLPDSCDDFFSKPPVGNGLCGAAFPGVTLAVVLGIDCLPAPLKPDATKLFSCAADGDERGFFPFEIPCVERIGRAWGGRPGPDVVLLGFEFEPDWEDTLAFNMGGLSGGFDNLGIGFECLSWPFDTIEMLALVTFAPGFAKVGAPGLTELGNLCATADPPFTEELACLGRSLSETHSDKVSREHNHYIL